MSEKVYKIGEAAQALALKSYVLRFWESEFPQLKPTRTESGQRLYSERDLELLRRIRHLLHERGLTIEGAKKILTDQRFDDAGLSGELLDENRRDFPREAGPEDEGGQAPLRPAGQAAERRNANSEALLRDTLAELKKLRGLLREPPKP